MRKEEEEEENEAVGRASGGVVEACLGRPDHGE
jgi:hypothetical protein